jgi:hypothetical protein
MSKLALGMVVVTLGATSCGSCKHGDGASDTGSDGLAAMVGATATPAPLSLPIAADHDPAGHVYVAGFVAARGAANVSRFDEQGRLEWSTDALDALTFSSDAHLDVIAAPGGAVVTWRGLRSGKRSRGIGRWVGGDGKVAPAPFDVGSNACTLGDDLFWIASKDDRLMTRHLPDGAERNVHSIPDGVDPTLICGDAKRAYLVEQGEDDLAVRPIENGKALSRVVVVGPDDLGDDELRDHQDFVSGDSLGELVLTEKGAIVLRQVAEGGASPRKTLDHLLGADEGFMAADGNKTHAAVVLARDESARCDGDMATAVVVLDVPLGSPDKERLVDVAQSECGRDLAPYWVAPTDGALYVAWAVRGPRGARSAAAPVEALVWAKVGEATKTVPMAAEDVVFAGCHAEHCAFAALMRPPGTDGMTPGEARIVMIP